MPTVVHNVTAAGVIDHIETALTSTADFETNVDATDYTVIDNTQDGIESITLSNPNPDQLRVEVGLNWVETEGAYKHPDYDPVETDYDCEPLEYPSQPLWSRTATIGDNNGTVVYNDHWLVWRGRGNDRHMWFAATALDRGTNDYQADPDTVTCECNAVDDPTTDCDGSDDTFTYDTEAYRGYTYAAILFRGDGISDPTYGTITGSDAGDIRTTPFSARLDDGDYGRDQQWEFDDHNGSLAGTHETWIRSDDDPITLSDRGTFTANGTYLAPMPYVDDVVFEEG